MKTTDSLTELLTRLIEADTALAGFAADNLPMAAKLRALNTMTSNERHFSSEELDEIETWANSSGGSDAAIASFRDGECCYYVCADASLYFSSSAESEVWAFASDFAVERIVNGYDGPLDEMDAELLKHLGGYLAEVVEERGTRSRYFSR
jgi:hypothetical protein